MRLIVRAGIREIYQLKGYGLVIRRVIKMMESFGFSRIIDEHWRAFFLVINFENLELEKKNFQKIFFRILEK